MQDLALGFRERKDNFNTKEHQHWATFMHQLCQFLMLPLLVLKSWEKPRESIQFENHVPLTLWMSLHCANAWTPPRLKMIEWDILKAQTLLPYTSLVCRTPAPPPLLRNRFILAELELWRGRSDTHYVRMRKMTESHIALTISLTW